MNNLTFEKSTQYIGNYITHITLDEKEFYGYGQGCLAALNDLLAKISWYFK